MKKNKDLFFINGEETMKQKDALGLIYQPQCREFRDRSNEPFDDAVKRYLDHPKDETTEQRAARINRFRCGLT